MNKITYLFLLLFLSILCSIRNHAINLNQYTISSKILLNRYINLIGNSNSSHVFLFTPYILEKTFFPIPIEQYSSIDKNAVGWYGSDGITNYNIKFSMYVHYTLGNPRFVLMLHYPYTQN